MAVFRIQAHKIQCDGAALFKFHDENAVIGLCRRKIHRKLLPSVACIQRDLQCISQLFTVLVFEVHGHRGLCIFEPCGKDIFLPRLNAHIPGRDAFFIHVIGFIIVIFAEAVIFDRARAVGRQDNVRRVVLMDTVLSRARIFAVKFPSRKRFAVMQIFERIVAHQIGVQTALHAVVDILDKNAIHRVADFMRQIVRRDLHRKRCTCGRCRCCRGKPQKQHAKQQCEDSFEHERSLLSICMKPFESYVLVYHFFSGAARALAAFLG